MRFFVKPAKPEGAHVQHQTTKLLLSFIARPKYCLIQEKMFMHKILCLHKDIHERETHFLVVNTSTFLKTELHLTILTQFLET